MPELTKLRSVIELDLQQPNDGVTWFVQRFDDPPPDNTLRRAFGLVSSDWVELGRPNMITVTVEPGDLLNG